MSDVAPVPPASGSQQQSLAVNAKYARFGIGASPFGWTPSAEAASDQPTDLWDRIREDLSWHQTRNKRIDNLRAQLLRGNPLSAVSERADFYLYYIVEEVQKRGMPIEIALIPILESSLNPFAAGPAGAAGLWQIMPQTGTSLGLERDTWYDGRHALQDSTAVALDYLEKLYREFDRDWLLAVAAYNWGAGNVARARQVNRQAGLGTDYWSLRLPGGARDYVPRVIALSQIVADPDQFGVSIAPVTNTPFFEIAETDTPLRMTQAAELAGVDVETLKALNPGHLRETMSPDQSTEILLPLGAREQFEVNIARLSPEDLVQWRTYRGPGDSAGAYQVRAGDSLYRIAGKFNVTVNDLVAWNALNPSAHLQPGQRLRISPKDG